MNTETAAVTNGAPLSEQSGRYARPAGILYLVIAAAAIVAHMHMPSTVFGPAGPTSPVGLAAAVAEFRALFLVAGLGGELVILVSETVLSVLLFALLAPVDRTVAFVAAAARLVMTAIHGFNLIHYVLIVRVATMAGVPGVFGGPGGVDTVVSLLLESHGVGFTLGIAFLPLHMGALGWLIWRSGYVPRWIGVLFILSGIGYLIDSVGLLFVPSYGTTPGGIAALIAVAELVFPFYLLIRGPKVAPA
jgi:hypothetical protein